MQQGQIQYKNSNIIWNLVPLCRRNKLERFRQPKEKSQSPLTIIMLTSCVRRRKSVLMEVYMLTCAYIKLTITTKSYKT